MFLEAEEESRIQNSLPSEYLIETLEVQDNLTSGTASGLVFENPTKEFIWVFRHNDRLRTGNASTIVPIFNDPKVRTSKTHANDIFNYSKDVENTDLGYGTKDPFNNLTLKINNKERFKKTEATFFRTMQPYKYHSNIPEVLLMRGKNNIFMFILALNPEEYQPTGSYNFLYW